MALSQKILDEMKAFRTSTAPLMFKCITNRNFFIDALEERCKEPININQSKASLCGAAAFMYCIAREKPDEYAKYVLDLANTGKASLGNLKIAPGSGPFAADTQASPVDWVALASLRDASNTLLGVKGDGSKAAGITDGGTLANWFKETGWFKDVRDYSSNGKKMPMNNLLEINGLPRSYVCLCIQKNIITDPNYDDKGNLPDHWVVLGDCSRQNSTGTNGIDGSAIGVYVPNTQDPKEYPTPFTGGNFDATFTPFLGDKNSAVNSMAFSDKNNKYRELENKQLSLDIYTWGDRYQINTTVKNFLKSYFGFVSAQWQ